MDATAKVKQIMVELSGSKDIEITDSLQDDLGFDSMNMVLMMIALEDEFHFTLRASDMDPYALKTVGDVVGLVERYLKVENET